MKSSGFIRHTVLGILLIAFVAAFTAPTVYAQADEQVTLEQMKMKLRDEGKGRDLSQLTHQELETIKPSDGGLFANLFNFEYVMKKGTATFIIGMPILTVVILLAAFVVIFFFTPVGLGLFRGGLHSAIGTLLIATKISDKFGNQLVKEPKAELRKEKAARPAFANYMHNHFIKEYKNNITAVAFVGTAFLILNIGLRGVKFMTAHEPTMIILAIVVEITVLLLLGMTTWYEKEVDEEAGQPAGNLRNKELTLEEVNKRIDALKDELNASVRGESDMYPANRH